MERIERIELPPELRGRLCADATARPLEACGFLVGARVAGIVFVRELTHERNVSPTPTTSFLIDPGDVVRAHDDAAARGLSVLGVWHSHPAGVGARPSRSDLAAAWPGHVAVIVSGDDVRAFRVESGVARELDTSA